MSDWETESNASSDLPAPNNCGMPATMTPQLRPVPSGLSKPGDALCETCSALNLPAQQFVILPNDPEARHGNKSDNPSMSLGKVEDMMNKKNCPFCRLVLVSLGGSRVPTHDGGEAITVDLSWSTDGPRPNPSQPWHHIPQVKLLRPYARREGGGFITSVRLNFFPEITLLANDAPASSNMKTFFVRPIDEEKIDFSLVQNWLTICETRHGENCKKRIIDEDDDRHPVEEIPDFRCIDVQDRCLVKPPNGCQYATLSYVWGRAPFFRTLAGNVEELEKPGAFDDHLIPDGIPATIRDAIVATREIGLRYLWVDSLCIVQDDHSGAKEHAIKTMDLVYEASHIVIMAASGDSAFDALPGVRPGTRNHKLPIEEIGPAFRLAFKQKYQDYTEGATYYTRGWTYQENHCARRSLVFIGGQVVFRCQSADQWREDVVFEDENGLSSLTSRMRPGEDDIGNCEGLIQNYSDRVFSFQQDIYNAFAGVARQLRFHAECDLCHGIPVAYFDWFLLWDPLADQQRREGAPSWSWSGWIGCSWPRMWDWYTRSMRMIRKALRDRTWIVWYQREAHDSADCRLIYNPDRPSSSRTRNFHGGKIKKRFDMDCSQYLPTKKTLPKAPKYFTDILSSHPGSGFLQFWTVSAKFRLNVPATQQEERHPAHRRRRLGIFGKTGRELGNVSVAVNWLVKNPIPAEREFILVCEARDERAPNNAVIDQEEGWRYRIMLVEWVGEYAERVAIGSIGKDDLKDALGDGAVWKEITLG